MRLRASSPSARKRSRWVPSVRKRSMMTFTAIRCSQVASDDSPRKLPSFCQARTNTSWVSSSASSAPAMRRERARMRGTWVRYRRSKAAVSPATARGDIVGLRLGPGVRGSVHTAVQARRLRYPIGWPDRPAGLERLAYWPVLGREKSTFGASRASGGRLEEGVVLEPEDGVGDVGRELAPRRVVLLHPLVVAHAFGGDAVLGAGELVGQPGEDLARLAGRGSSRPPPAAATGRSTARWPLASSPAACAPRPAWPGNRRWPGRRHAPAGRSPWSSRPGWE